MPQVNPVDDQFGTHRVFGDRDSGAHLIKFSWTWIVRHQRVKGEASPYDPALVEYWNQRRGKDPPPLGYSTLRLLQAQHGRCPRCGDYLLHADHQPASPTEMGWRRGTRGHSGGPSAP